MLSASPNGVKEIFFAPMISEAFSDQPVDFRVQLAKLYFPSLVVPTRFFVSWFKLTPLSFEASEV